MTKNFVSHSRSVNILLLEKTRFLPLPVMIKGGDKLLQTS